MVSPEDTEITLGTGKLLGLFFFLVGVCALFFALGYSLGRKAEPAITTVTPTPVAQPAPAASKVSSPPAAAPPVKPDEQKEASPGPTPAAEAKPEATTPPANANPAQTPAANPADSTATLPTGGYFVQVAAVSKQEDADALVDALKKKDYPAFVAPQSVSDKLFHVQVGPYADVKDAEAMRTRLIGDGYSPILKK
jgi:DedD protein